MDTVQRLILRLSGEKLETVEAAYNARVRQEQGRIEATIADMKSRGMVEIEASDEDAVTEDGRPIMRYAGRVFIHTRETHNAMLEQQIAAAKERKIAESELEVREAIAATTCPQMHDGRPCGGALNRKGVCGGCDVGKMGYRYRYQCDTCGFDIVTREPLK